MNQTAILEWLPQLRRIGVALIIGFETPERFLAMRWFAFATVLFGFGWVRRLLDFRIQGYSVAALAAIAMGIHEANVASGAMAPLPPAVLRYVRIGITQAFADLPISSTPAPGRSTP